MLRHRYILYADRTKGIMRLPSKELWLLEIRVQQNIPGVVTTCRDAPAHVDPRVRYFLDIQLGDLYMAVEWRLGKSYGIHVPQFKAIDHHCSPDRYTETWIDALYEVRNELRPYVSEATARR